MKWPWVSRAAYDARCEAEAHWREMATKLAEHFQRMERIDRGRSEIPPQPKPALPPMPENVRRALRGMGDDRIRANTEADWTKRARKDGNWSVVEREARRYLPQEVEG